MKQIIIGFLFFICSQTFSQQTLFVCDGNNNLYSLNIMNCTSSLIGITNQVFGDIAFTSDGKLWGVNGISLYKIDTSNATITFIGTSNGTHSNSLVALNDSTLLSAYFDTLEAINVSNAKSYPIGVIGYEASGDFSWYENNLYMTASNGQLIKIVLNSMNTAIISSTPVNSVDNPITPGLGLATACINGSESLIGFAGTNAYIISPQDGSYQLLCSLPITTQEGIYGAAYLFYSCTLPITLINFFSILLNKSVELKWQTAEEISSDYFLIERSGNGVNFTAIGEEKAAGNSGSLKHYVFVDGEPLAVNYYRLKEVDFNGNFMYSDVLLVKMGGGTALTIMQNPVGNSLLVEVNGATQINTLVIYDFSGRRLERMSVGNGVQRVDVSGFPAGSYVVELVEGDGEIVRRRFEKE